MESIAGDDARRSLDLIGATRLDLADRLTNPWWFHPALGLLLAQMVLVYGFADGSLPAGSALLTTLGALALVRVSAARSGLSARIPKGPRGWVASAALGAGMVVPTLYVVLVDDVPAGLVVALSVSVLLAAAVLGPVYDAAHRADLRDRGAE